MLRPISSWSLTLRVSLTLTVFCILWSEWLALSVHQILYWRRLNAEAGEICTPILIVADPQLIGYQNEIEGVGPFSRWDADRYVRRGYSSAHSFTSPSLVLFLGDLFDEGVEGTDGERVWMEERFREIFTPGEGHEQYLFVPGDNDVGGESEPVVPHLIDWFRRTLRSTVHVEKIGLKGVDIREVNEVNGEILNISTYSNPILRVVVSHFPVLKSWTNMRDKVIEMSTNLILSGHDHLPYMHTYSRLSDFQPVTTVSLLDEGVGTVDVLIGSEHPLVELQLPTCSYRMGVPDMAYGYLKLCQSPTSSSSLRLRFSLLSVPGRYPQLYVYVILLLWWSGYSILWLCSRRNGRQRYTKFAQA